MSMEADNNNLNILIDPTFPKLWERSIYIFFCHI